MDDATRAIIDASSGSNFMEMDVDDAWALVEKTALHNQRYSTPRSARKSAGVYDVDTGKAIANEIAGLR